MAEAPTDRGIPGWLRAAQAVGYVVFFLGAVMVFTAPGSLGAIVALMGSAVVVATQLRIFKHEAAHRHRRQQAARDEPPSQG